MLPLPSATSIPVLADWVEYWCLSGRYRRAPRSEIVAALEDSGVDSEAAASSVWLELSRRADILGYSYPYRVEQGHVTLRRHRADHSTYKMLLVLSVATTLDVATLNAWALPSKIFEYVACAAISGYTGGRVYRIGFPREAPVPRQFPEVLRFVTDAINEDGPLGAALDLNPASKDAGVDVLAWRPFADGRAGQLVVLGQCAIGKNWTDKLNDFSLARWRRYLGTLVDPVRAFASPHTSTEMGTWQGLCLDAGIVLDRLRLAEMARGRVRNSLRRRMEQWYRAHLDSVKQRLEQQGYDH